MRHFDYSFLESAAIPARLAKMIGEIGEFQEREKVLKKTFPDAFIGLEIVAKGRSVKCSNDLEGLTLSDFRFNEVVFRDWSPLNQAEKETVGYRDALNLVFSQWNELDIRESDICRLHETMTPKTRTNRGRYKDSDNVIMGFDISGEPGADFAPMPAAQTAEAMKGLILAYGEARDNLAADGLLLIPCFILDFLCVHPFSEGNGKISRLLSHLLLNKNGFDAGRYISFEEQINKNKASYFQAFKESSKDWHTGNNDYFPFVTNFVATLLTCHRLIDKRFAYVDGEKGDRGFTIVRGRGANNRERIESALLNSPVPISKRRLCQLLPDVKPTAVRTILKAMLKAGLITQVGLARSAKYFRRELTAKKPRRENPKEK
ncbi:MAG: Fic family protein [Deltaproteobacteria bacterium]|nr:Fic family protein [Deltaproteobacteria bacterium]